MKTNQPSPSIPVRPAACAGRFYPAGPDDLRMQVTNCLRRGRSPAGSPPKAVIAPHAGYIYSGPIAGSAFARWQGAGDEIRRIVVIGPAHYVEFEGLALSSAEAFETPLGRVQVDLDGVSAVRDLPQVCVHDPAHGPEHCLEVELPFLQVLFETFSIVPVLVGITSDTEVEQVLERLWGGAETRIVVSSDLSHYRTYLEALSIDAETARAIEALRPDQLHTDRACGSMAVRGLLRLARRHGLNVTTVDLRNSGDTAGPRDRVVGYGAFLFSAQN